MLATSGRLLWRWYYWWWEPWPTEGVDRRVRRRLWSRVEGRRRILWVEWWSVLNDGECGSARHIIGGASERYLTNFEMKIWNWKRYLTLDQLRHIILAGKMNWGKVMAGRWPHGPSHHHPSVDTRAKTGSWKTIFPPNFYVSEFVEIVPGILCHPHHVIFASISV